MYLAKKDGTELDDTEKGEVDTAVSQAMENINKLEKDVKGLSESDVRASIEKQKLAEKQKKKIIDGFDIDDEKLKSEVNKEDFHQYTIQYYTISKEDLTKEASATGEKPLKDDITLAREKKDMEDLLKKVRDASDFSKQIVDSDGDQVDDKTGIQYGEKDLLETDTEFADADTRIKIKIMKNDQISNVIESAKAFYIVKMINNDDPKAYDNEVKSKIETEENSRYQTYYDDTLKKQYTCKVQDYWKSRVEIGGITA